VSGLRGRLLAGLGAAALLAGCGGGSPSPTSSPGLTTSAQLSNVPTGTAVISWDAATRKLSVKLAAYGLTPSSAHAVHLHATRCVGKQGAPTFSFPDVTADAAGAISAEVTATEPAPKGIPAGMEIDLHLVASPDLGKPPDTGSAPIACTDIPPTAATRVAVRLYPFPGEKPAGSATLGYDAGARALTVRVTGFGLAPGSAHAADIDLGSCQKQGEQRYTLKDTVADARGKVDVTTTLSGVDAAPPKAGWYLVLHQGSRSEILAAGKPAPLFRPILCGDVSH
jgi:hypothetical protein